jgi:O-antigen ligase
MVRSCWILALSGTLVVAAVEIVTGAHFAYSLEDRAVGGAFGELPYASVFFGNYNNYSTYLCLAYPMVLGAIMDAQHLGRRLALVCCAVLTGAVVLVNTSRMAMLFVAFVTVCAVLTQRRTGRLVPIVLLAAVAGIVQATEFSWQYTLLRLGQVFSDDSTSERAGLVVASIDALAQSLGLGLGPGGFVEFVETSYPHLIPNPHNMLLEFAVNFGIVGAALFIAAIVVIWMAAWRAKALPLGLRFPLLVTLPCVPLIGAINSLAVGYTYWWVWIASTVAIVAAGSPGVANRSAGSIEQGSTA